MTFSPLQPKQQDFQSDPRDKSELEKLPSHVPLIDHFGRRHHRLRLSVTDRCNLRCSYCMPEVGATFVPKETLLSFEETTRIVSLLVSRCGVDGVRLTGGEPLLRRNLDRLVGMLSSIEGLCDISLTTNAILLPQQADALRIAGLKRINISIDSLDRQRFAQITRRDQLPATLAGIEAAIEAGFDVKLNALAIAGVTETDLISLVKFAIQRGVAIRFIEFMPLDADGRWLRESVLNGDDLLKILASEFGSVTPVGRIESSSPAEEFDVGGGRVGIIRSVSKPFCSSCNRLRLTADGAICNCLFATSETPLRDLLRGGASDDKLIAEVLACVESKARSHGGTGDGFAETPRAMYSIGG